MNKRFVVVLAVFVALFAGLLIFNKRDNPGDPGTDSTGPAKLTEHKIGAGTSGVTLIEYGDFECPACAQYFSMVEAVKQKYGDQITFQFRHFPLSEVHRYAIASARAAEAADRQGKFWEMYKVLYERQDSWKSSSNASNDFEAYAKELGLDIEKYKRDVISEEINDIVQADRGEARKLGLTSTPSFIIDGKKVEQNPRSMEDFYKLIDETIKAKQGQ